MTNFLYLGGERKFRTYAPADHCEGDGWTIPPVARPQTFLHGAQLLLLERCALSCEQNRIAGDFIEAGVWRGGAVLYLRALLEAYGIEGRQIIAADSFAGIPQNKIFKHDPVDKWADRWVASLEEVKATARRYDLLDDRLEFLPGFFEDTLGKLAGRKLALVRIDCDAHDSVYTALTELYPLLSPGGIIIIDDWHLIGCRFAVNKYRSEREITDEISVEAGNGYWTKAGLMS